MKKLFIACLVIGLLSYAVDCFGDESKGCIQWEEEQVYKCERCGYESTNPFYIQFNEDDGSTELMVCPKCLYSWCDKNMPKMEVIE